MFVYVCVFCFERPSFQSVSKDGSGVHVVMGNEACDMDSMVSALTFAYFLSKVGLTSSIYDDAVLHKYLVNV